MTILEDFMWEPPSFVEEWDSVDQTTTSEGNEQEYWAYRGDYSLAMDIINREDTYRPWLGYLSLETRKRMNPQQLNNILQHLANVVNDTETLSREQREQILSTQPGETITVIVNSVASDWQTITVRKTRSVWGD